MPSKRSYILKNYKSMFFHKKAFSSITVLKKRSTTELILIALNLDNKIMVEVNMSDYATESVLLIEYIDGK